MHVACRDLTPFPLAGRAIAAVDSNDVVTSDRPHRKAKTKEQAIEEISKGSGRQFDPEVVEVFVKILM